MSKASCFMPDLTPSPRRRNINVPEVQRTGSYTVQVKLHPEVPAEINMEVESH